MTSIARNGITASLAILYLLTRNIFVIGLCAARGRVLFGLPALPLFFHLC